MIIQTAKFVKSSSSIKQCPAPNLPEYAFIGRSNVGKSSLVNMLTGNRRLAKISGKPGKTQLINHFLINDNWFLVDLPGYGFARVSKTQRDSFSKMTSEYILNRENLHCIFVLVDIRLEPQKIDDEFISWLGQNQVPLAIIFTKSDKLGVNKLASAVEKYQQHLSQYWEELPPLFTSSAITQKGREEILQFIHGINNQNLGGDN